MNAEVVASGMRAGSKGATSTSGSAAGAGAGAAAFFFLVPLFLDFLAEAAATPMQQSNKPIRSTHAMIGMQNPAEPEAVEPRLAWEPEESPEVKESDEPPIDANDAEDSPLEPDDESLHGATVVGAAVGAAVSFALTTGATGTTTIGSGVVAKAPAMPPATTAADEAATTPMAIFCGSVKPALGATTTGGAHGS